MAKVTKKKAAPTAETPAVSAATAQNRQKSSRRVKKSYIVIAVLVLLIAAGSFAGYTQYDKVKKENLRLSDPQESARAETERTKQQVASLIEVPTDEDPTIATVKDSSQLQKQAFYNKAQNGDRVLFYAKAKKAILYRPDTNKIIEVATLNIDSTKPPQTPETQQNSRN